MKRLCAVAGLLLVAGSAMLCLAAGSRADDEPERGKLVRVPNVLGLTLDQAKNRLAAVGLITKPYGDINAMIRGQSPAAGALVARGSFVTVVFPVLPAPDTAPVPALPSAGIVPAR